MNSRDFFENSEYKDFYKHTRLSGLYVIKQNPSEELGLNPSYIKIGIANGNIFSRLRQYNTYWPAGFRIFYIALVSGETYNDKDNLIFKVESLLKKATFMTNRIRNTESYIIAKDNWDVLSKIKKFLLENKDIMSLRTFTKFRHHDANISPTRFNQLKTRRSNRIVTAPSLYPRTYSINTKIKNIRKKKKKSMFR
jgi:hypothetical protein